MAKAGTWVITGDGSCAVDELAQAVQGAGGAVQQRLGELNILIVRGSASQAGAWRRLAGVAAVEADAAVDIGPPGADPA